ncbi:hypothetical protein BC628DRAFT_1040969 [Trametes gibbosa]|nr:hypothetical protein BC628DRAFT_1040969 [Trametes gibbosa]
MLVEAVLLLLLEVLVVVTIMWITSHSFTGCQWLNTHVQRAKEHVCIAQHRVQVNVHPIFPESYLHLKMCRPSSPPCVLEGLSLVCPFCARFARSMVQVFTILTARTMLALSRHQF